MIMCDHVINLDLQQAIGWAGFDRSVFPVPKLAVG